MHFLSVYLKMLVSRWILILIALRYYTTCIPTTERSRPSTTSIEIPSMKKKMPCAPLNDLMCNMSATGG